MWNRDGWNWEKRDWLFFACSFGLLILHPVLNGYPFLFGDSWAYCCECPDSTRSPVLGCTLRPLVLAAGNWGYVAFQCAAAAFILAFLNGPVLKRRHPYLLFASILISGIGISAGWIMADVWTLIGLICLFAISTGYAFPAITLLLSFSCSTHFGNFPTYTAAAVVLLPLVRHKAKFALRVSVSLLAAVAFIGAVSLLGGVLKITSGNGFSFLASRMLHDYPELIDDVCREEPEFGLCRVKGEVRHWSQADPGSFIWIFIEDFGIDPAKFEALSRRIVLYSLSRFPGYYFKHLEAAVRNTVRLLAVYELSDGHIPYRQDPYVFDSMQKCFPGESGRYLMSWQGDGRLQAILKCADIPLTVLFWLSAAACTISIIVHRQARHEDALVQLAIFASIAVFLNAFFMSNISGVFGRYHTRIGFLLVFPGLALSGRLIGRWLERRRFTWLSSAPVHVDDSSHCGNSRL